MKNRVMHLEAALVRSELDLCRARTELEANRREAEAVSQAKDAATDRRDRHHPVVPGDIPALYHALEGSVVLLQIASEKMLRLEHTIAKHREAMPRHLYRELQDCVTQDAMLLSPLPRRRQQHGNHHLHHQR
ncbi:unnamed protein product [Ectocarpus sp. 4 AP-2014]